MILVGTEKLSILWATKKGSTTLNRIVEHNDNISKFNWDDDYDGLVLIPCRRFESSLQTSYCEFFKTQRDKDWGDFISELRSGDVLIDKDFQDKWKKQIEKFLELDLSDEWLSELNFIPETQDITKIKSKSAGGDNASLFYLSTIQEKFKIFDLNDLCKVQSYASKIDERWNEEYGNTLGIKYNNTGKLQQNIAKFKKMYYKHYIDRHLFAPPSHENSIIHVSKYCLGLLHHIYRSESFFYNILARKFLFKGE